MAARQQRLGMLLKHWPDPRALAMLAELDVDGAGRAAAYAVDHALPFHPVRFQDGERQLSFFSMITPVDVTAQELRIEAFFPADDETERFARAHLTP